MEIEEEDEYFSAAYWDTDLRTGKVKSDWAIVDNGACHHYSLDSQALLWVQIMKKDE